MNTTINTVEQKREVRKAYKAVHSQAITFDQYSDILDQYPGDLVREVISSIVDAQSRIQAYKRSPRYTNRIRKYANRCYWTDWEAYEVVRIVSPNCVEIRPMKSEIVQAPQAFTPGGFCGHYSDNHSQKWSHTSDPEAPVTRIRLGKKGWGNGKYHMMDNPYAFYDYNF
jgi:hypothetical protein